MKVSDLIKLLMEENPDAVVVIEKDDEYWHIADLDDALLEDPGAKNPVWDFDNEDTYAPNAVRICM